MFVAVSTGRFVVVELVLVFASSFGRWVPAALTGFSSSSMFVVVVVAGY